MDFPDDDAPGQEQFDPRDEQASRALFEEDPEFAAWVDAQYFERDDPTREPPF